MYFCFFDNPIQRLTINFDEKILVIFERQLKLSNVNKRNNNNPDVEMSLEKNKSYTTEGEFLKHILILFVLFSTEDN